MQVRGPSLQVFPGASGVGGCPRRIQPTVAILPENEFLGMTWTNVIEAVSTRMGTNSSRAAFRSSPWAKQLAKVRVAAVVCQCLLPPWRNEALKSASQRAEGLILWQMQRWHPSRQQELCTLNHNHGEDPEQSPSGDNGCFDNKRKDIISPLSGSHDTM